MHEDNKNIVEQKSESKPIDELRDLILGLQPDELNTLQKWLRDRDSFTHDVSDILPYAVIKSVKQNDLLAGSLLPVVEDAIFSSVQKNPKALADALFPIMGPAIRQSISDTFRRMIQSLNETLESQFSPQRIKWRIQAMFSSQSYAEIVLLNGLQFNVLSVLLIHKESGLLLSEVHAESTKFDEADMVSSMLTAIQDFIQDSFANHLNSGDTLDTIRLHDFNVWIEDGPYAYLAVVFEGEAPESNRLIFKSSLETIHKNYTNLLQKFDGDTSETFVFEPILNDCLISQRNEPKKSNNKKALFIFIAFLLLLSSYIGYSWYNKIVWNHFISDLEKQPSVLIVDQGRDDGKYFVKGMKDNLAPNFVNLALQHKIDTADLRFNWTNYISLAQPYNLMRIKKELAPPQSVTISYQNNILVFKGKAPKKWVHEAKRYCENKEFAQGYDYKLLQYSELDSINKLISNIQNKELVFNEGVSLLNKEQKDILDKLLHYFIELKSYQPNVKITMAVTLDDKGSKNDNIRFAKQRINSVKRYFAKQDFNTELFLQQINIASKTNKPRTLKFVINTKGND